jgi:hypothetical protein
MKRVKASDFPELQRVFSAYLHEDFLEEYDTPAAAVRAFLKDADGEERARFRKEAKQFVAVTAAYDLPKLRSLLSRLGSRWTPPSRDAVIALLSETQS